MTGGVSEEEFLQISSCPYSENCPSPPQPCFLMNQNLAKKKKNEKGHQRNVSIKLFKKI